MCPDVHAWILLRAQLSRLVRVIGILERRTDGSNVWSVVSDITAILMTLLTPG